MSETQQEQNATASLRFDNSEQTPQLKPPLHSLPYEQSATRIPPHEQDHDAGRFDPRDGQAVVDLLNEPPDYANPDDIGTSEPVFTASASYPRNFPDGVFYGDLRQRNEPASEEDRYDGGLDATTAQSIDWKRWDLYRRDFRSYQSAQPASGLR